MQGRRARGGMTCGSPSTLRMHSLAPSRTSLGSSGRMRTATCTLSAFLCEDIAKAFDAQMVLRARSRFR